MTLPANIYLYSMAFDSTDANRLYLATNQGLLRSLDAGDTWSAMSLPQGSDYVTSMWVDPMTPGTITLATGPAPYGILRSVDRGASWESIPWPFHDQLFAPVRITQDAGESGNLIVGTAASGLFEFQIAPDLSVSMTGLSGVLSAGTPQTLHLMALNKPAASFGASDAELTVNLPSVVMASAAVTTRGTCALAGQTITCRLGALKPGDFARIDVPLTLSAGNGNVVVTLQPREPESAAADNQLSTALSVKPSADLGISLGSVPTSMVASQTATTTATVMNNGPDAVLIAAATLSGSNLRVLSATPTSGSCAVSNGTASCSLGSLAATASNTIEFSFSVTSPGSAQLDAVTSSEAVDGVATNNSAQRSVVVTAESSGGSGGGTGSGGAGSSGGGAMHGWTLLLLGAGVLRRVLRLHSKCDTFAP
jgi:hypothetical protein